MFFIDDSSVTVKCTTANKKKGHYLLKKVINYIVWLKESQKTINSIALSHRSRFCQLIKEMKRKLIARNMMVSGFSWLDATSSLLSRHV
jgi:ATP-dependent protease HslVU (ClpYQ) ATPase subunit